MDGSGSKDTPGDVTKTFSKNPASQSMPYATGPPMPGIAMPGGDNAMPGSNPAVNPYNCITGKLKSLHLSFVSPWKHDDLIILLNDCRGIIESKNVADSIAEDNKDIADMVLEAKMGNFSKALEIIKRKPYIINTIPEERAWSVLHQAVYHDDTEVVKKLLEFNNCDSNIKAKRDHREDGWAGMTPLQLAKKRKSKCRNLLESHSSKPKDDGATFLKMTEADHFQKSRVTYFDLGCSFLKPDIVEKMNNKDCNFLQLMDHLYKVLEDDWQYVRQAIAECLYPFNHDASMQIRDSTSRPELKKNLIGVYTGNSIYRQVNAALRRACNNEFPVSDDLLVSLYTIFLEAILVFWKELPGVTSHSYRGLGLPREDAKKYKPGVTFCWLPFTSTTLDKDTAEKFARQSGFPHKAVFIINNKKASSWRPKDVSKFSDYPEEEEVLHPSGALFKVTEVTEVPKQTEYHITLL